jgi:ribosomal protein S18 acetylase RimI-like enzyme
MRVTFFSAYGQVLMNQSFLSDRGTAFTERITFLYSSMENRLITYREHVIDNDVKSVREIIASSGFFYATEADVAVELVEERLKKGIRSGYYFLFAEQAGRVIGYTCFGPIACTVASYDLYWIAVHNDFRGQGIGKALMEKTEEAIAKYGGTRIYIETAFRKQYEPTRMFYLACGYREEAVLEDFYAPGDGKVIYVKVILSIPALRNNEK